MGWEASSRLLEANNRPAATVLRVNRRRTTTRALAQALGNGGVMTRPGRFAPDSLCVVSGPFRDSPQLRRGEFWVQDEASQLVVCLFGERLGSRVADLCAAPGGKSMQLAESLPEGGILVAVDRHGARLARLARTARRLGAEAVVPVQADMTRDAPFSVRFPQVLLDAPCSGTGTLRRHPEIRWRLRAEDLKLLSERQTRLLDRAAALTEPGGMLVYSVCSVEPEEGDEVVQRFLQSHPEFRTGETRGSLPPAGHGLIDANGFLRTSPDRGGLDGFFAALLLRELPPSGEAGRSAAYNASTRR
jgi:16S rRNA (cytosine967-C5)-methyltransferase